MRHNFTFCFIQTAQEPLNLDKWSMDIFTSFI